MNLDHELCYRALRTRDPRFDGRFFTGVTSTGVYCRPICPARTPRPENCAFFACAAAAEAAGFRPCLRCRPDTIPGTPAWDGTSTTVSRALRLIEQGALDHGSVPELADRLGVGERHLRRLFHQHLGIAPLAVAGSRRAHFARRLLEDTALPVGQVALAAGYHNPRRLHAAVRKVFQCSPSELRRRSTTTGSDVGTVSLRLAYREPLDWEGLLGFLKPRAIPGVENVEGGVYRRTFRAGESRGRLALKLDQRRRRLVLEAPVASAPWLWDLVRRARHLADLDADPVTIMEFLARHAHVGPAATRWPGQRVPGAWDAFETAVRAIVGQQVTVKGATRLMGRLVERCGTPLPHDEGWLFPTSDQLARADLSGIGMPAARVAALQTLARRHADQPALLTPTADLDNTVRRLTALPGIGDWTAQYVAMRALREPDAFPAGDLVLRKALADGPRPLSPGAVRTTAEPWRPWRAYAAMLLWRTAAQPLENQP